MPCVHVGDHGIPDISHIRMGIMNDRVGEGGGGEEVWVRLAAGGEVECVRTQRARVLQWTHVCPVQR